MPTGSAAASRGRCDERGGEDIRGAGVIWGIALDRPAAPVVEAALDRGLLINRTADTVLRLLPPYIVNTADVDQMAVLLDAALDAVEREQRA